MGAGAKVWNPMALWAGLITAALIIPVFCFRHYIQDKGKFPDHMLEDLNLTLRVQKACRAAVFCSATSCCRLHRNCWLSPG